MVKHSSQSKNTPFNMLRNSELFKDYLDETKLNGKVTHAPYLEITQRVLLLFELLHLSSDILRS